MKKKNITYLGLTTYITIAIISSCTIVTPPQTSPSPSTASEEPSSIEESTSPDISPTPSVTPSATTNENTETKATLSGTIYDNKNMILDGVEVNAESIDPKVVWKGNAQLTYEGKYLLKGAPIGSKIRITASKSGLATRTQTQILTSNITGDVNINKFDFKDKYALQDEPEVTSIKINDKEVTDAGKILTENKRPESSDTANITSLDPSNMKFEIKFSEPIKTDSFKKNLLIRSQVFEREFSKKSQLTTDIDSSISDLITFDWSSDRKSVIIKTVKPLLAQKSGNEAKYSLEIPNTSLIDDNGKQAFSYNTSLSKGTILFSSGSSSDNVVFSVKNDDISPTLLSVTAKSSATSNNSVELKFSEPLEVTQFISPTASLNINESGFTEWNGNGYELYLSNKNNNEDIFVLAQVEDDDETTDITNDFKGVDWNNTSTKIEELKVDGSKVTITLSKNTLVSGKKLVASVSRNPKINGVSFSGGNFAQLRDPAGNSIDTGKSTTSLKMEVNGTQRVIAIN